MNEHDNKYIPVEKQSGTYVSPPPTMGYPTRDKGVGDPPAKAVEKKPNCCHVVLHGLLCCGHIALCFCGGG
ncbi:hypothetical protein AXX17_AT3G23930 [Arabidopsis thaliana]|uniref:Cysteine-rich transmembrane CYSTM domain-containing protein n=1 Tax=Arabidopsis thaliana TaxID=3702 RepID=A0A178V9Z4_ARATH|nr:hypothetical protein AXX17_AT3G23930 [Arabidopsis thaliana]